jgi:hypothetical protein
MAANRSVEGRSVSGCQVRVESLLMGRWPGRGYLYTRETRNGLWDSAARLEKPMNLESMKL